MMKMGMTTTEVSDGTRPRNLDTGFVPWWVSSGTFHHHHPFVIKGKVYVFSTALAYLCQSFDVFLVFYLLEPLSR